MAISTKGKIRLSQTQRKELILSQYLQEVLFGIMLSDGHVQRRSKTGNSRFTFGQSTENEAYFWHVFNLFKPYCTTDFTPKPKEHIVKGVLYYSLDFATMQLPCFNYFREIFYVGRTKVVPAVFTTFLTPVSLAFWIMCDGSAQGPGLHLNTYKFTPAEHDFMVAGFKEVFGINCTIHPHSAGLRLYIGKDDLQQLIPLILPHMHSSMKFKLGL